MDKHNAKIVFIIALSSALVACASGPHQSQRGIAEIGESAPLQESLSVWAELRSYCPSITAPTWAAKKTTLPDIGHDMIEAVTRKKPETNCSKQLPIALLPVHMTSICSVPFDLE